ncbi:MAG: hypothetical protein HC927_13290 [Deltaproteobacteria bacterium]|nr:hypothetical protein [Deltaproteobacteria bacterium]
MNAGARLCISATKKDADAYPRAVSVCRNEFGRVCTYEDITYLYRNTSNDANYNPLGVMLGNLIDDDTVICGNRSVTFNNDPDVSNFEGPCGKSIPRPFWCCHDDDS